MPANAAVVDELKSTYHQKERDLRELMERLAKEEIEYDIEVEHKEGWESGLFGRFHYDDYLHRVKLPRQIAKQVESYQSRFVRANFPQYLRDPRYSFYAALLYIHWFQATPDRTKYGSVFPCRLRLEPLEKHDKALWDSDLEKYTKPFLGENLTSPHAYREKLFYESIPQAYLNTVFSDKIYRHGASIIAKPVFLKGKSFAEAVSEFNTSGNTTKLRALPLRKENLEVWLYLALSGGQTNRLEVVKDLCTWCRQCKPQKNHFLAATIMGLFIVDGYSFDDEKGTYQPNELGKLLLDYIMEFPIPENAFRLKIITNGGNEKLIEDLMKKHGTSQAWQELLKNPVKPTFVEFKQHPRKK